jgi:hypothetical protein
MKAQLSQERDAVRHVTLQKDIDLKDLQTRLDKTVCFIFFAEIHRFLYFADCTAISSSRVSRWCRNQQSPPPRAH